MANNSTNSVLIPNSFGANSFFLKHKNEPIFNKTFDGSNSDIVDIANDTISIKDHFFATGEKLIYSCPEVGTRIAISTTSPGNTLGTSFLPSEVYPIVINSGEIRLAFSKSLANTNQYINITDIGVGVEHSLKCEKQNTKCLMTIDNIIQSPVSISAAVGIVTIVNSNSLVLESLEGISEGTILKLNNEYAKVIKIQNDSNSVGVGTVTLFRSKSVLGTEPKIFDETLDTAYIMSGQYNIVKDILYFTDSPFEGKKYNYPLKVEDFSQSTFSFNLFNTQIKTGSLVGLTTQNPPQGMSASKKYFAIKNYENNFSFANNYQDAISGVKLEFNLDNGEYDPIVPVGDMILNVIDISGGSTFSGRAFLRSNYDGNKVFDDISEQFNGITTSFELKESGISTVGIASDNGIVLINNIFQYPEFEESFYYEEPGGTKTNINFIGFGTGGDLPKDYDVNVKSFPRGGIIVGYALSSGRYYQPLKVAKLYETNKVESAGIYYINNSNIGIAYSGSGYRNSPGYAASVTFVQNGERISGYGTATISNGNITSVNVSSACTYSDPDNTPIIVIDPPLEYENMPVTGSLNGVGAKVSLQISEIGEISNFKFTNPGYGYSVFDVLTVPNMVGTTTQLSSDTLKIKVIRLEKDKFSAWNLGNLRKLDDLSSKVNGTRRTFNLSENSQLLSLEALPGSPIELDQNVLVFVNDVLQVPQISYTFNGGTQIILSEAPPAGSTLKIYFYTGSDNDTTYVDIDPKVKVGDKLVIKKNIKPNPQTQSSRTVKRILSSDKLKTEIYNKKGLSYNSFDYRPVDFTPQKEDSIIGGEIISKSRESLSSIDNKFTSVASKTGTFEVSFASTIGINTSGLQIGDYIESEYTDSYNIISIQSGVIGISTSATNTTLTSSTINIWRKI